MTINPNAIAAACTEFCKAQVEGVYDYRAMERALEAARKYMVPMSKATTMASDDVVVRLRAEADNVGADLAHLLSHAADEIERLRQRSRT